jgi:Acyl-CoA thioesterase C-terminal domain/Acyl-CoA thioesterase N-terminal domain
MDLPAALYVPTGDGYLATALTIGPWDAGFQHAGPPAALLAREAERVSAIEGGQTLRLCYDILGPVPVGPVQVRASVPRPGRRVELVEAVLEVGGRPLMRLSAWRMRVRAEEVPADPAPAAMPATPEGSRREDANFFTEEIAYHRALEWRFAAGSFNSPGPAAAWTRPACQLVEGEPITPLEHLMVMTDAASGISAALDWTTASFANVDLSVALRRAPHGEWLGMDAGTFFGGSGAAQCFAALFDDEGLVGRSSHTLFVEPR